MNWDDPSARLTLIESVGVEEYNARMLKEIEQSVIETVAGHRIRAVNTRWGPIFMVGSTGSGFLTLEKARAFAIERPAPDSAAGT